MNVIVSAADENLLISKTLLSLGASEREAAVQADVLTEADLCGFHSHGLQRLPVLVQRVEKGLIKLDVRPDRQWTADAVMSVDGKHGFGTFVAESSLQMAASVARGRGVAAVAIRNSSHIGMVGYYCGRRAEEGLICIGFTTSEALVHPHGGGEALVGTNPIAIGIPASPRPFVLDMASSTSALGKLIAARDRGERLPDGWAVDENGFPTNDPEAGLRGSLTPAAGPKGYGLGVAIGILAGLLPGGEIGRAVLGTLDVDHRCTKADLFLLLDPKVFPGGETLACRVRQYLDELRASRPQFGVPSVLVSGDLEHQIREERLKNGIPFPEEVWNKIQDLHASLCH